MGARKFDPEELRELILIQFGSQANLARKLGIKEPAISKGIKLQSGKFLLMLRKAGLKLDTLLEKKSGDTKNDFQKKFKDLQEKTVILEEMIKQKDKVIENQNNLIEKYTKILDEMIKEKNKIRNK